MRQYRKKPVVINAMELTRQNVSQVIKWVNESRPGARTAYSDLHGDGVIIPTLEGDHLGSWGDYIIQGIAGEFYPCKPDIFLNSYEEV